jgi:hypothetical protein
MELSAAVDQIERALFRKSHPAIISLRILISMRARLFVLALALLAGGCLRYEYEHELWLKVDGSGRIHVTGQPRLWQAFKGVGRAADPDRTVTTEAVKALFERSGLHVRRVTLTQRGGEAYVFVAADFEDVNALSASPAFPDLALALRHEGDRLRLEGRWQRPAATAPASAEAVPGLLAVRFHLPSKVYEHKNAADGVERGNIVGWRQDVTAGLRGAPLEFGAVMDERSILWSTIGLFALAIGLALTTLAAVLYWSFRRGRRRKTA